MYATAVLNIALLARGRVTSLWSEWYSYHRFRTITLPAKSTVYAQNAIGVFHITTVLSTICPVSWLRVEPLSQLLASCVYSSKSGISQGNIRSLTRYPAASADLQGPVGEPWDRRTKGQPMNSSNWRQHKSPWPAFIWSATLTSRNY